MIRFGFKQFEKHLMSNVFLSIQLAVSLLLIVAITSSIFSKIQYYIPVKNILNKTGIYLFTDGYKMDEGFPAGKFTVEDIKNENKNIQDIYALYQPRIYWSEAFGNTISSIAYDETTMSLHKPELIEGVWVDEFDEVSNAENNYINVVVNEKLVYAVGDTIIVYQSSYNRKTKETSPVEVKLKVAGVMKANEFVYGNQNNSFSSSDDFRMLFSDKISLCFRYSDLEKSGVSTLLGQKVFLTLHDGANDTQLKELWDQFLSTNGAMLQISEFSKNSNRYLYDQVYIILPILVCIVLLLLVSSISLAAIQTKRNIKSYALYYICGSRWKTCLFINFINSLLVSLLGIVIAMIGINLFKMFGILKNTVISLGFWQIVFCTGLILFNLLISLIMPIRIMKKSTPKDIITSNE